VFFRSCWLRRCAALRKFDSNSCLSQQKMDQLVSVISDEAHTLTSNGFRNSNADHQGKQQGEDQLPGTDDKLSRAFVRLERRPIDDRQFGALKSVLVLGLIALKSSKPGQQPCKVALAVEAHDLSSWQAVAADGLLAFAWLSAVWR
jgi:hypothetical protein